MALKQKHKITKHDRYVLDLKDKIKHKYDFISTNVKVARRKRSLGEIDLVARKGNEVDIYEVKCSYRILKAKKQLKRMKKLLRFPNSKSFFYCGSSGALVGV
jgi:predicted RecB family endonuclease